MTVTINYEKEFKKLEKEYDKLEREYTKLEKKHQELEEFKPKEILKETVIVKEVGGTVYHTFYTPSTIVEVMTPNFPQTLDIKAAIYHLGGTPNKIKLFF